MGLAGELKKAMVSDSDTFCNWYTRNNPQRIGKVTGRLRNKRTSRDNSNSSIIKIGQKTKKTPEDLTRLALTQTPRRNYELTLVLKK